MHELKIHIRGIVMLKSSGTGTGALSWFQQRIRMRCDCDCDNHDQRLDHTVDQGGKSIVARDIHLIILRPLKCAVVCYAML